MLFKVLARVERVLSLKLWQLVTKNPIEFNDFKNYNADVIDSKA